MSAGDPADCPICGQRERAQFNQRPLALCVGCGALERQRALARRFDHVVSGGAGRSCLEIGPLNRRVFGEFLVARGWRYRSVDRWRTGNPHDPRDVSFATDELDLCDLWSIASGSHDLLIAQHVLEQTDDFRRALDEVCRVLTTSGVALLDVPFCRGVPESRRQVPDRFGVLWSFGADLLDELRHRFRSVQVVPQGGDEYPLEILAAVGPRV